MKLIYIHGFNSTGGTQKSVQLKKAIVSDEYSNVQFIAPDLSYSPQKAIDELSEIINKDLSPSLLVGSSLGGFYGIYLACKFNVPAVLINPSLIPFISMYKYIGSHIRFNSEEKYEFTITHINELEYLFIQAMRFYRDNKGGQNLHFYLASDDEVQNFDCLNNLFPERASVNIFDRTGHQFSRFSEIIPNIKKILNANI